LVIWPTGRFLYEEAEDQVIGVGVLESGAGLKGNALVFDESIELVGCPGRRVAVLGISVDRSLCVVRQAGSLIQQMANGDVCWKREPRDICRSRGIEVDQTIVNQRQNQSGRERLGDAGYTDRITGPERRAPLYDSTDRSIATDQSQQDRPSLRLIYLIELVPQVTLLGIGTADQERGQDNQADSETHPTKSYADILAVTTPT
jgi:hypothetical protein